MTCILILFVFVLLYMYCSVRIMHDIVSIATLKYWLLSFRLYKTLLICCAMLLLNVCWTDLFICCTHFNNIPSYVVHTLTTFHHMLYTLLQHSSQTNNTIPSFNTHSQTNSSFFLDQYFYIVNCLNSNNIWPGYNRHSTCAPIIRVYFCPSSAEFHDTHICYLKSILEQNHFLFHIYTKGLCFYFPNPNTTLYMTCFECIHQSATCTSISVSAFKTDINHAINQFQTAKPFHIVLYRTYLYNIRVPILNRILYRSTVIINFIILEIKTFIHVCQKSSHLKTNPCIRQCQDPVYYFCSLVFVFIQNEIHSSYIQFTLRHFHIVLLVFYYFHICLILWNHCHCFIVWDVFTVSF